MQQQQQQQQQQVMEGEVKKHNPRERADGGESRAGLGEELMKRNLLEKETTVPAEKDASARWTRRRSARWRSWQGRQKPLRPDGAHAWSSRPAISARTPDSARFCQCHQVVRPAGLARRGGAAATMRGRRKSLQAGAVLPAGQSLYSHCKV